MVTSPEITALKKYLREGSAAVIVGAGFSLNAERKENNKPLPPLWNDFSIALAKGILGIVEDSHENTKLLAEYTNGKSPTVLTQEYESLFGRKALVDLIRGLICDENLSPAEVHRKLLRLPWADVYTTNYDTLLERAAGDIHEYDYRLITLPDQIVGSKNPRIVKLHGTWHGADEDWVITEEDYRRYPRRRAPFVNMVRQSAMEACLCLIGFSGTDPNFLAWIGWVRDYLGDTQLPIFLVLNKMPAPAELLLYKRRNIVVVCLSSLFDSSSHVSYAEAYNKFFDQLVPNGDSCKKIPLPDFQLLAGTGTEADHLVSLRLWIKNIEVYRSNFVGYLVIPYADRESINVYVQAFTATLPLLKKLELCERVHFALMLEWLRSQGLRCMPDTCYTEFLKLVEDAQEEATKNARLYNELDELRMLLWRAAREKCDDETWRKYNAYFERDSLTDKNAICYERMLKYMAGLDVVRVAETFEEWRHLVKGEEWQLKYASCLIRACRYSDAAQMVKKSLKSIRRKIPSGRRVDYRYFLQLEGIALYLLRNLSLRLDENVDSEEGIAIQKRLDFLSGYKCDPSRDLELYNLAFERRFERPLRVRRERNFGQTIIREQVVSSVPDCAVKAGDFVRFVEATGLCCAYPQFMPINDTANSTRCEDFIQWYSYAYPRRLGNLTWWLAMGGEKLLNAAYSEVVVDSISCDDAERVASELLQLLKDVGALREDSPLCHVRARLVRFALDVLSRIIHKIQGEEQRKVFKAGLDIFRHSVFARDREIFALRKHFFARVGGCLTTDVIVEFLPDILESVPHQGSRFDDVERLAPLTELPVDDFVKKRVQVSPEARAYIDAMTYRFSAPTGSDDEHNLALKLAYVESLGLLSASQRKDFARSLRTIISKDEDSRLNLTLAYLQRLLPNVIHGRSAAKFFDLLIKRLLRKLPESPTSFNADEQAVYLNIVGAYGFTQGTRGRRLGLSVARVNEIFGYVINRIEGQLIKIKEGDPIFNQIAGGSIRRSLCGLDQLLAEVLMPKLKETCKARIIRVLREYQKCEEYLPRISLSFALEGKTKDAIGNYLRAIDLFGAEPVVREQIAALRGCGYLLQSGDSRLARVAQYLVEVMRYAPCCGCVSACCALAEIVSLHPQINKQVLPDDITRLDLQTRFGGSARFDDDCVRECREAVAYLAGTVWAASGNRRKECLAMGKDDTSFSSVNLSWRRGADSVKGNLR